MTSRTIPQQPITTSYTSRPWWQLGLGAGVIAAVINSIIYYVYNAVATTPIQVTMLGRSEVQDLPVLGVVFFSLVPALLAALLAAGLKRWTSSASTWFVAIAVILGVVSLASPLMLPDTIAMSAKLTLASMHIVAAATIIGTLLPKLNAGRD